MSANVAIILFPGSNCEKETLAACKQVGIHAEIVRWNTNPEQLARYDAYILPGGFSYQDRVRAGAIAAKLPVLDTIRDADRQNKPILGICNGCQILAESGIMPNTDGAASMNVALAPNRNEGGPIGFMCEWMTVSIQRNSNCVFTRELPENTTIPIPINHGEGRFVFDEKTAASFETHTIIRYTNAQGNPAGATQMSFPENPNGSTQNIAGLSNKKGNVLAIMPHPERAISEKQIPHHIARQYSQAPLWNHLFLGLKTAIGVPA
ncbi:MAG: phosphoribosylformylglycinamidine synthase I [bacterium]|nr:phosphoribosylformylglycinamidine synthase I [bacterium]